MPDQDRYDDWIQIPAADPGSAAMTRFDPDHPLDFWRGRDEEGKYLFCLQPLDKAVTGLPDLTGIKATCPQLADNRFSLRLVLSDSADIPIFSALVRDLLAATQGFAIEDNERGSIAVLGRLRQWQEMLERARTSIMTRSKIIGLFGELTFLKEFLAPHLGWARSVASWVGGFGDEQDFAVGSLIVETKTQATTRDAVIKISSEHQLDTSSGEIVIRHLTLAPGSTPSPVGFSTLNELVLDIKEAAGKDSVDAVDQLELALLAWGYKYLPEYDKESWQAVIARNFEVVEGFPRIVASDLASGLRRVRYEVTLEAASRFQRDDDWLRAVIDGGDSFA